MGSLTQDAEAACTDSNYEFKCGEEDGGNYGTERRRNFFARRKVRQTEKVSLLSTDSSVCVRT